MFEDRKVAKLVEKCYTGNAKEEDFIRLLNCLLENSTLVENFKIVKPEIKIIEMDENKRNNTRAEYDPLACKIYINSDIIKKIMDGEIQLLCQLIETFGHETKHCSQDINGDIFRTKVIQKYKILSTEEIKHMFEMTKIKGMEEFYAKMSYITYYMDPLECEARKTGAEFVVEVLEKLLNNKKLKQEIKDKISEDFTNLKEKHKQDEAFENAREREFEAFKNLIKRRTPRDFVNEEDVEYSDEWSKAVEYWMNLQTPLEIVNSYINLIGTGATHHSIREEIVRYMKSESCPTELVEGLAENIVYVLTSKAQKKKYYEYELREILSEDQILEIYEALVNLDFTKIDSPLFEDLMREDGIPSKMADILARNLENIKINSPVEEQFIQGHCRKILFLGVNEISEKTKNELNKILNRNQTQQSASKR